MFWFSKYTFFFNQEAFSDADDDDRESESEKQKPFKGFIVKGKHG